MIEQLISFIENLKTNPALSNFDEASTKQAIILPILQMIGWNIFDTNEVKPEFVIKDGRVDYSLRLNDSNEVFIEVKSAGESLEKHEEQLLDYAFREGVELATLTNGITWSLYLPTKKGDWKTRKFYTIDIIQQDSKDTAMKFTDLLSKKSVQSRDAFRQAESIYSEWRKKKTIEDTLPEVWNKIITEPDELLIELVNERTEKVCGFKPEQEDTIQFLKRYEQQIVISSEVLPTPTRVRPRSVKPLKTPTFVGRQKAGRVTLQELVDARLIQDGQDLYFYHTRLFKDEKVTVMAQENKLKYTSDGNDYSVSMLAKKLLQKHGFQNIKHDVAGPLYWKTRDGKLLNDLNEIIRERRGDRK